MAAAGVEVERLVVRLEGDIGDYVNSLGKAQAVTGEFARDQEAAFKEGRALALALRTPMEVYNAELRKAQDLLKQGAITTQTFERANARAAEQFQAATAGAAQGAGQMNQRLERAGRAAVASSSAIRGMQQAIEQPTQAAGALSQALAAIPGWMGAIAGAAVGVGAAIFAWATSLSEAERRAEEFQRTLEDIGRTATRTQDVTRQARLAGIREDLRLRHDELRAALRRGEAIEARGLDPRAFQAHLGRIAEEQRRIAQSPQMRALREAFRTEEAQAQAEDLVEELQRVTATTGLTEGAARRWELAQRGASAAVLATAAALDRLRTILEVAHDLHRQYVETGLTPVQVQLRRVRQALRETEEAYRAAAAAAAAAQQRQQQAVPPGLPRILRDMFGNLFGGAAAAEAEAEAYVNMVLAWFHGLGAEADATRLQLQELFGLIADEARRVAEAVQTPSERFAEQAFWLDVLLATQAITAEQHAKAMKQLEDSLPWYQLRETADEAQRLNEALAGTPAAAARSAEALSRIEAFRARLAVPAAGGFGRGGGPFTRPVAGAGEFGGGAGFAAAEKEQVSLLKRLVELQAEAVGQPAVEIDPADFE
jgi:hypothetical protein